MLSLIQRVTSATVTVEGEVVGTIEAGLLALVGVEPGDGEAQIARMAEENHDAVAVLSAATERLNELAGTLRESMARFRV